MPRVSIIIPTHRSRDVLTASLQAIAQQRFDLSTLEVILVYNGPGAPPAWPARAWPFELLLAQGPPANVGAARNVGFARARGQWVLLLNDDVLPAADLVAAHLAAHAQLQQPALVLGETLWRAYDDETVFDRLLQTTSMVFFYDQMRPHTWYNFRHAWTLNLSLPRSCCDAVRFDEALRPVNFDDLEWAYRLEQAHGLRVWYAPEARATHDHRYTLEQYLARERELGRMAALLWRCNPDCYRAIYGVALDRAYLEYCRRFIALESQREAELRQHLGAIVTRRPESLGPAGPAQQEAIRTLYFAHLPLKRLEFRRGLVEAASRARPTPPAPAEICCI